MLTELERLLLQGQRAIEAGDAARALIAADEVLKREPAQVDAMFQAGNAMMRAGNTGLALQFFNTARQATDKPHVLAACWNNIGACLQDYRPDEAYQALLQALKYGEPRETYDNLCNVASQIGRHEEALSWADKSEKEARKDASYNRSFALFNLGRWTEAWACFDRSIPQRDGAARSFGFPRWDGKGGRPIVHGEQGIGDEILWASLLPADFNGIIECEPRNETLFARSFPQARVYGTRREQYIEWVDAEQPTHEIEMGGLGRLFAPEPFRRGAFLRADGPRVDAMSQWLRQMGEEVRVGIAWTGGSWSTGRARRSVPFQEIKRLFDVPGVTFVNLEYENRREELAGFPGVLDPRWATKKGADMDDLAALVASLHLVIAPTTSVVDLAGALGVECWAMVDEHPQWRYSPVAGPDAMWFYESVRCFRQQARDKGGWHRVVGMVKRALLDRLEARQAA